MKRCFCFLAAAVIASCRFPYAPEPFTLPEQPYKFPSAGELQTFFGTTNVKLVYTLKESGVRSVYFVDFNDSVPLPKKLKKPAGMENFNADSPLISPDGSFVAYYLTDNLDEYGAYIQRLDGSAEPVTVASYGTEPHWWQDDSGEVYVIFSDRMQVTTLSPGIGATYRQRVVLSGIGSLAGGAEVTAQYPMNGGLSRNGRYLCTGYYPAAFYDITTGPPPVAINSGVQVCNPSITPDTLSQARMMFLNFGGLQNMTNPFSDSADFPDDAGGNVPQHAVIFIVDISNTVIDFVPIALMGAGFQEWQDPEWSNSPDYAAALALIDNSRAELVVIKNVGTRTGPKEKLVMTRGSGKMNATSTPSIWIGG